MGETKVHIMRFGTDMWCGAEVHSESGLYWGEVRYETGGEQ